MKIFSLRNFLMATTVAGSVVTASAYNHKKHTTNYSENRNSTELVSKNYFINRPDSADEYNRVAGTLNFKPLSNNRDTVISSVSKIRKAQGNVATTKFEKDIITDYWLSDLLPKIEQTNFDYRNEPLFKQVRVESNFENPDQKYQNLLDIRETDQKLIAKLADICLNDQLKKIADCAVLYKDEAPEFKELSTNINTIHQETQNLFQNFNTNIYKQQSDNITLGIKNNAYANRYNNTGISDVLRNKKDELITLSFQQPELANELNIALEDIDNIGILSDSIEKYALKTPNNADSYEQTYENVIELNNLIERIEQNPLINTDDNTNKTFSKARENLNGIIKNLGLMITNVENQDKISQDFIDSLDIYKNEITTLAQALHNQIIEHMNPTDEFKNAQNAVFKALYDAQNTDYDYRSDEQYQELISASDFSDTNQKSQNLKNTRQTTTLALTYLAEITDDNINQLLTSLGLCNNGSSTYLNYINKLRGVSANNQNLLDKFIQNIDNEQIRNINLANGNATLENAYNNTGIYDLLNNRKNELIIQSQESPELAYELNLAIEDINNVSTLSEAIKNYALSTPNNAYSYGKIQQKVDILNSLLEKIQKNQQINNTNATNTTLTNARKNLNKISTNLGDMVTCFETQEEISQEFADKLNKNKLTATDYAIKILANWGEEEGYTNGIKDINYSEDNTQYTPYYNINGQITYPNRSGLYIKNGKKIIIK